MLAVYSSKILYPGNTEPSVTTRTYTDKDRHGSYIYIITSSIHTYLMRGDSYPSHIEAKTRLC